MNAMRVLSEPRPVEHPWRDWTAEQWANAVYCDDCGLPLLEIPSESGSAGTYQCVYCTWLTDHLHEASARRSMIERLNDDAAKMQVLITLQHNLLTLYARRIDEQRDQIERMRRHTLPGWY